MSVKWRNVVFAVCVAGAFCLGPVEPVRAVQLRASVETGMTTPDIADPVAYLGGVSVLAYFDDSFGGYCGLWGMGFPVKPDDYGADFDSALAGGLGVEYRLNVARGVPYLRAGGGIIGASGSPSVSAPTVELGVGMRWRVAELLDFGVELGRYEPMDDLGGIGGGAMLRIQLGYQMEF